MGQRSECPVGKFSCLTDRGWSCLTDSMRCDMKLDCIDALDEDGCVQCNDDVLWTCQTRNNGLFKCINKAWRCDRYPDCPDASDETNCAYTVDGPTANATSTAMNIDTEETPTTTTTPVAGSNGSTAMTTEAKTAAQTTSYSNTPGSSTITERPTYHRRSTEARGAALRQAWGNEDNGSASFSGVTAAALSQTNRDMFKSPYGIALLAVLGLLGLVIIACIAGLAISRRKKRWYKSRRTSTLPITLPVDQDGQARGTLATCGSELDPNHYEDIEKYMDRHRYDDPKDIQDRPTMNDYHRKSDAYLHCTTGGFCDDRSEGCPTSFQTGFRVSYYSDSGELVYAEVLTATDAQKDSAYFELIGATSGYTEPDSAYAQLISAEDNVSEQSSGYEEPVAIQAKLRSNGNNESLRSIDMRSDISTHDENEHDYNGHLFECDCKDAPVGLGLGTSSDYLHPVNGSHTREQHSASDYIHPT